MSFSPFYRGGSGTPLVLLHGFIDNPRTWDLVRPALEAEHDVVALALPGHAGGVAIPEGAGVDWMLDALERTLDDLGLETPHVAGNSLGGFVALKLAERGRAQTVTALAPAGGWAAGDESGLEAVSTLTTIYEGTRRSVEHADAIVAQPSGRRMVTNLITVRFEHIPAELLAHQIRATAAASGAPALAAVARAEGWRVDASRVGCPVRFVWGSEDKLLPWPSAAAAFQADFPTADWELLDDVGHCPQLDVPSETAQLILGFTR